MDMQVCCYSNRKTGISKSLLYTGSNYLTIALLIFGFSSVYHNLATPPSGCSLLIFVFLRSVNLSDGNTVQNRGC